MYNGIGLATVRGSGTNGYVTKNLSFVSASRAAERKDRTEGFKRDIPQPKQPDQDIIEHNRKRDVEVKVLRLRETLEDKGVDEAEIEAKTAEMRKNLLKQLPKPAAKRSKGANEEAESRGSMDTHARAAAKESETKALKSALGIEPGYVAGSAFDRELQQKKRDERQEQREAEANKVVELEARRAPPGTRWAAPTLETSRAYCPCPSSQSLIPRHRHRPRPIPPRPTSTTAPATRATSPLMGERVWSGTAREGEAARGQAAGEGPQARREGREVPRPPHPPPPLPPPTPVPVPVP
jgi:serine/arginine repetitive matrix protein 2